MLGISKLKEMVKFDMKKNEFSPIIAPEFPSMDSVSVLGEGKLCNTIIVTFGIDIGPQKWVQMYDIGKIN